MKFTKKSDVLAELQAHPWSYAEFADPSPAGSGRVYHAVWLHDGELVMANPTGSGVVAAPEEAHYMVEDC